MFIHYLVWDDRYTELFLKDLLTAIFCTTTYCANVILTYPPWVSPSDSSENSQEVYEQQMTKIVPRGMKDSNKIQVLYLSVRELASRLDVRRVVEEDNDDVIPIIDAESTSLKEHYGEYYISEMVRNPDGHRQIIVSQTDDGIVTGVMCVNDTVEIDLLHENFELVPYNGLRKPHPDDKVPPDALKTASQIFYTIFTQNQDEHAKYRNSLKFDEENEIISEELGETLDSLSEGVESQSTELEHAFVHDDAFARDESAANASQTAISDKMPKKHSFQKEERHVHISRMALGLDDDPEKSATAQTDSAKSTNATGSSPTVVLRDSVKKKSSLSLLGRATDSKILIQKSLQGSSITFYSELQSNTDQLDYLQTAKLQLKMRANMFGDTPFDQLRTNVPLAANPIDTLPAQFIQDAVKLPTYYGDLNVFVLEIFATGNELNERYDRDFLEAAFECFPDLDYCAMLVPYTQLYFPFLEHFVRIPLRCNKDFPMTLYLSHKAVLLGKLKPRQADRYDRDALRDLLDGIPRKDAILSAFYDSVESNQSGTSSYVFECHSKIVGVAILCVETCPDLIKYRYYVDEHISMRNIRQDCYGRILHFVIMPMFSIYMRFFFRELMRLSELTVLFYRLYESDSSALTRNHPLANCLNSMFPVAPRRQIEYKFLNTPTVTDIEDYENLLRIDRDGTVRDEVFSLYMISPRLSMVPLAINDVKIIVVGASDCGLALVEYFALGSMRYQVRFTNLTLISPNGLPFERKRTDIEASMIPFRGRYCHDYRHLIGARSWINIVYGTVIGIDRKHKYVTVMHQGNLTYDYLILTCGLQYQKPIFPEETEAQKRGEVKDTPSPWNCLTINDDTEVSTCFQKVRSLTNDFEHERSILFYGNNIDCYCALRGLMKFGVKGSSITLIEPPLHICERHDSVFFDDPEVDRAIMNGIRESGVTILSGWNMIDWVVETASEGQVIKSVLLEGQNEQKKVECDALLNFCEKSINMKLFLAICRAGLVFDGQLVIDPECRTNDPFIFAGGTGTKYSRKFYAEARQHKYCNSIEVGESLGKALWNVIDRVQRGKKDTATESKKNQLQAIPRFSMPICLSCTLPGDYYYLHVQKPGKRVLPWKITKDDHPGEILVTGSCTSEIGYFRIRINMYQSVETVTCVSRKAFEVQHMIALYGKHQSMLNEVKLRYAYSQIPDLFEFFREPWAAAVFHDNFEHLRIENREILLSRTGVYGDSLIDDCTRAFLKVKWEEMLDSDRRCIESKYTGSVYQQQLEERLLGFLQFAEDELPMYCNPRIVRQLYADIEDSPLYFDVWS